MAQISLGIDFGTSTTSVAFRETGLLPEVLPIGENGALYMPSVVAFTSTSVLIGEQAVRAGRQEEVVASIKRCLGCDGSRCRVRITHKERAPRVASNFNLCNGGLIHAGDRDWHPQEIALLIIREALERSVRILVRDGYDISTLADLAVYPANLGCSTVFDLLQRNVLVQIAHELGFVGVSLHHLIEEPIAAGIGFAYLENLQPGRTLIYDFGGGTFDAAVVDVNRGATKAAILSSGGVAFLGGDDIDAIIMNYFLEQIGKEFEMSSEDVRELLTPGLDERELRSQAEQAKVDLSDSVEKDVVLNLSLRQDVFRIHLDRTLVETLLLADKRFDGSSAFERSMRCVEEVLRKAKVYSHLQQNAGSVDKQALMAVPLKDLVSEVDWVVRVGGVTKMPFIRERLESVFGVERLFEGIMIDDPITVVAKGAALDKEYENLVLPAPPYSVIATVQHGDSDPEQRVLYEAYQPLWPNRYSDSRADFRYLSEAEFLFGQVRVGLLRHSDSRFDQIYETYLNSYLRVEIDESAGIHILTGPSPTNMSRVHSVVAPWQHEVQIIPYPTWQATGHLNDPPNSTLLSN